MAERATSQLWRGNARRGQLARRYPVRHEGKRYELWVAWRQGLDADTYDYWIRAMLARTEARRPSGGPRYEVIEKHIERLRSEEQRQQALDGVPREFGRAGGLAHGPEG